MNWYPRQLTSDDDGRKKRLLPQLTDNHPLKPFVVTISERGRSTVNGTPSSKAEKKKVEASTSWGGVDPLSAALQDFDANLTVAGASPVKTLPTASNENNMMTSGADEDFLDDNFESWSNHKMNILKEYTTSEKLSIKTSFLNGGNSSGGAVVASFRNLQSTSLAEKVKHRLQQLDDFEEGSLREMFNLSQQEYVHRIEDLNRALRDSWESDQRVKALKIAIQCAKLLVDVSVIQFYPSKFVLITDMLDNFGNLVYKRIHCKAETPSALASAQETCRNWFYKIASIRELVPRFYVEAAILKTLSFIVDGKQVYAENCKALRRLTSMIRGIGDPLVAIYARAYLCRVATRIAPMEKSIFHQNLSDFFLIYGQLESNFVLSTLTSQKVPFSTYLTLFIPALDWILQCLTFKASETLLLEILEEYKSNIKKNGHHSIDALVLNSMINSFRPDFIIERAQEFVELIKDCLSHGDEKGRENFPGYLLLRNLGICFVAGGACWSRIEKAHKLMLMNEIWRKVSKLKSSQHIACANVWMDFVVKYLGIREVNALLKDIVKHMQPDRAYEDHYDQVISIIQKVTQFSSLDDFTSFFAMDSFIPFLDMLQKESVKVEACKIIVQVYVEKLKAKSSLTSTNSEDEEESWTITDPVTLNSLTYLCKTIHGSVNALTLEDDKREISNLIIDFLSLVSFQRDFQAHLNFLVEARSIYSHSEPVVAYLVTCVNRVAMETKAIVKGHHTKKTSAFTRACLAYSYITIPSLEDTTVQLQLYLNSAQVALANGCLPQTDAFLKAAIDLIPSMTLKLELADGRIRSLEPFLITYIANFLSFLLIVPDHPEKEPLQLFRDLFDVIKTMEFDPAYDTKPSIYLEMMNYLFAAAQENYPYHIDRMDSNDTLYGHEAFFLDHINSLGEQVIEEILLYLKTLGERKLFKRQSLIALECFYRLIVYGDTRKVAKLTFNLWQLGLKNNVMDSKSLAKCISFVQRMAERYSDQDLFLLSQKMASLGQ